jgi:plastocyanin
MRRLLPLITALVLVIPTTAFAVLSATRVSGTTGPGLTITLKKAGKKVTRLTAGQYTITVSDKSANHNFVLTGPGVRNRVITGLAYRGTKSVTLRLRRGTYTYYCTPHRAIGMKGTFRVT